MLHKLQSMPERCDRKCHIHNRRIGINTYPMVSRKFNGGDQGERCLADERIGNAAVTTVSFASQCLQFQCDRLLANLYGIQ